MKFLIAFTLPVMLTVSGFSQDTTKNDLFDGLYLLKNENQYVKLTFLNQVWIRYTELNPGSALYNDPVETIGDIGLRRTRLTLTARLSDRVLVYTQFGMNNFSFRSERESGAFFHDAITEYTVSKDQLTFGGGLTAWTGFSRYSTPSIGSILSLDAPLFAQATNGATDQFLRKLTIYAKGQLGKLDYRLAVSKPMSIQQSSLYQEAVTENATFSHNAPHPQYSSYINYMFLEKEKHVTPYFKGSYLGKKDVFNVGAGFLYQKDAMWYKSGDDTVSTQLFLFSVDAFLDKKLSEKGNALTIYGAYYLYDFGPDHLRNIGVMNPVNNTIGEGSVNGPGNGFPAIGTGSIFFLQGGYKFEDGLINDKTTIQPYFNLTLGNFDALEEPAITYEGGLNYLVQGHKAKLSLGFQNRPVFSSGEEDGGEVVSRKNMAILQYQISF